MPIDQLKWDQLKANDEAIVKLDLSHQSLSLDDIRDIITATKSNTHLKILDVSGNPLSNEGITLLTTHLVNLKTLIASDCKVTTIVKWSNDSCLTEINLTNNEIDNDGIIVLAQSNLETLQLAGCYVDDIKAGLIALNNSLTKLILSNNKITNAGAKALSKNARINFLSLSHNYIQVSGAKALASNDILKTLYLASNKIGCEGVVALANNNTLTSLDLSSNEVCNIGIEALGLNQSITKLNVSYNHITALGIQKFILNNKHVIDLSICYNLLNNEGAIAILSSLIIEYLNMAGNKIDYYGIALIEQNKILKSLNLSQNPIENSGGIILSRHPTIEILYLINSKIGDFAANALSKNTVLKTLVLLCNPISEKGKYFFEGNSVNLVLTNEPDLLHDPEITSPFLRLSESFYSINQINGIILYVNPSFSKILGYEENDIIGKSAYIFLHPQDKLAQHHLEYNSQFHQFENRYRCYDGSYRTINWISQIVDKLRYLIGSDISEYRHDQKIARHAQRLSELKLVHEIKEHARKRTNFIDQLTHEILNPLNGILGSVVTCRNELTKLERFYQTEADVTPSDHKDEIRKSIGELSDSIKKIENCAKYQNEVLINHFNIIDIIDNNFIPNNKPLDFIAIFKNSLETSLSLAGSKQIIFTTTLPKMDNLWLIGDENVIKRIILDMLMVLIKQNDKANINITLIANIKKDSNTYLIINISVVRQNSTEQDITHMFNEFVRLPHNFGEGYDISNRGLYFAKKLANHIHGDIIAENVLPGEVKLTLLLNLKNHLVLSQQKFFSRTTSARFEQKLIEEQPDNEMAILVVDDNMINRKILCKILRKTNDTVIEAENGQVAIDYFINNKSIKLIFMDLEMPVKNGLQATSEIRELEAKLNTEKIKIVAVTANISEESHNFALANGFDDYLSKPINQSKIEDIVNAIKYNSTEKDLSRKQTY